MSLFALEYCNGLFLLYDVVQTKQFIKNKKVDVHVTKL